MIRLELKDVHTHYGSSHASCSASNLEVTEGRVVCLLGRNGAGKTTTMAHDHGIVARHPRPNRL